MYKSRTFFLWVLIIIVLQLNSCDHSTLPEPFMEDGSYGIVPLKVGYHWEYKTYSLKEDGSIRYEIDRLDYKITQTSLESRQKYDKPVYHMVYTNPYTGEQSSFEWFYRNYNDGLYLMGGKMPTDSIYTKILTLKYPVKKGETWKSPHLVYNLLENKYMIPDTINYTCTDTNAVFETPIGNFSCIVYYHREKFVEEDVGGKLDIYEYYSKEIGLVGIITNSYHDFNQKSYPQSKRILYSTNVITNKN